MDNPYSIKELAHSQIKEAMDLTWKVFLEFEAPDYTEEGIAEFKKYISPDSISGMLDKGEIKIWACFDGETITGLLAIRPPAHISLLFVEKAYHRKGIARSLFNAMLAYCKDTQTKADLTVHSSPYAQEIYHRFGFQDTDCEQEENGLRFIPMKRKLYN